MGRAGLAESALQPGHRPVAAAASGPRDRDGADLRPDRDVLVRGDRVAASLGRAEDNSGAPSVLIAYGEHDAERLRDCGLAGTFVEWRPAKGPVQLELFTGGEIAA